MKEREGMTNLSTKDYYISDEITLKEFSENKGYNFDELKKLNAEIEENEILKGKIVCVPCYYQEIKEEIETNVLEPYLRRIRPLAREVIDILRKFNERVFHLHDDEKRKDKKIFTYVQLIKEKGFSKEQAHKLFAMAESNDYRLFQEKIIDAYFDSVRKVFDFDVCLIAVYHFICHLHLDEITISDKDKIKDILEYTHSYFLGLLTNFDTLIEYISASFEMLQEEYTDFLIYKNVSVFIDSMLPILDCLCKKNGTFVDKIRPEKIKDFLTTFKNEDFQRFGLSFEDKDIFDFSIDFTKLPEDRIKKDFEKSIKEAFDTINENYNTIFHILQNFHNKDALIRLKKELPDMHAEIRRLIGNGNSLYKKLDISYIDNFYQRAENAIVSAENLRIDSTRYNPETEKRINKFYIEQNIYLLSVSLCVCAADAKKIPFLQAVFAKEEVILEKCKNLLEQLNNISRTDDNKERQERLDALLSEYYIIAKDVEILKNKSKGYQKIENAVMLVGAVALLCAVTYFSSGTGTASLLSSLETLGTRTVVSQTIVRNLVFSYTTSLLSESSVAFFSDRPINVMAVMGGTVTGMLFATISGFSHNLIYAAFQNVNSEVTKTVLRSLLLIATNSVGMLTSSLPMYMLKIGQNANSSWLDFIKTNLVVGIILGILESLFGIGVLIYGNAVQRKEDMLKKLLYECKKEYEKIGSEIADFSITYDKQALERLISRHRTYIGKLREALKQVRSFRDLLTSESYRMAEATRNCSYETIRVAEYQIECVEKALTDIVCLDSPAYVTATVFHNNLPRGRGLVPLGGKLYAGNIVAIENNLEKLADSNSRRYKLELFSKAYPNQDQMPHGTVQAVIFDARTGAMVDTLTIFDVDGRGELKTLGYQKKLARNSSSVYDKIIQSQIKVMSALEEYIKLCRKTPESIIKEVLGALRDIKEGKDVPALDSLIHMSENERFLLREEINRSGKLPIVVARFDDMGLGFAEPPVTFVFDIVELLTVRNKYDAFINVGYSLSACERDMTVSKTVRIFYIHDRSCLVKANVEGLQKGFDEIVKRYEFLSDEKNNGVLPHIYGKDGNFYDEKLHPKTRESGKMYFSDILYEFKKLSGAKSNKVAYAEMRSLLKEINEPPFTDKYKVTDNYLEVTEKAEGRLVKIIDKITEFERLGKKKSMDYKNLKKQEIMLRFQACYLSAYGWWANNGYALTPHGKKGFGEYLLLSVFDKGKGTMRTTKAQYECVNPKSNELQYSMNNFYEEK